MTRTQKKGDDRGLAGVLEDTFARVSIETDLADILAAPEVSEHDKAILRVAVHAPVSFEDAVEALAASPLMQALKAVGGEILTRSGGPNPIAPRGGKEWEEWILELYDLVKPETREEADMTRPIEVAKTDPFAFDDCHALWQLDQRREGMPNWQLRLWWASEPKRPSAKGKRNPKLDWRDAALTLLIADAVTLGFDPFKNPATEEAARSACDVVREALRRPGFSPHHVPTVSALEHVWRANRHRIPWLSSEILD